MVKAAAVVGCGGCWSIFWEEIGVGVILMETGDNIQGEDGEDLYTETGNMSKISEFETWEDGILPLNTFIPIVEQYDNPDYDPGEPASPDNPEFLYKNYKIDVSGTGFMQYIEITGTGTSTIQDNRLKDRRIKLIVYGLQALKPDLFTQDLSLGTVTSDLLAGINDTITLYY
jgi:hypothetical protein